MLSDKGQSTQEIGGVIALIVTIVIGAFVAFSITGSVDVETDPVSVENQGTATLNTDVSVASGTLTMDYDLSDNIAYSVSLNGSTVVDTELTGSGSLTTDVSDTVSKSNSFTVSVDNTDRINSLTTTLDVTTESESTISDVENKGGTSFSLMTLLIIVIVSVMVIGVVLTRMGGISSGSSGPRGAY